MTASRLMLEMQARAKTAETQFTRETKQEYADLRKELKANMAAIQAQIAAAIKADTSEAFQTLHSAKAEAAA
eukprot:g886.t1